MSACGSLRLRRASVLLPLLLLLAVVVLSVLQTAVAHAAGPSAPQSQSQSDSAQWDAAEMAAGTNSQSPAQAAPAASASMSEPLSSDSFVPPVPAFPLRFRAKCRFLVGPATGSGRGHPGGSSSDTAFSKAARGLSLQPSLLLVHFDAVSLKVREDFYALQGSMHRRFLSTVRDFAAESEWLVYHKQKRSPRACFQVPFSHTASALLANPGMPRVHQGLLEPAALQEWAAALEYQGLASITLLGEGAGGVASNVTVLHYKTPVAVLSRGATAAAAAAAKGQKSARPPLLLSSDAPPVHLYLHPLTHQPLVISTPHTRIDVLSFQALDDEHQIAKMQRVFDANKISKAKCVPFTPARD